MHHSFLRRIIVPAAALLLALPGAMAAGPAEPLRLKDAYQRALEFDNAWNIAQHQYRAAQEAYPIARAALLPNISAGGSIHRQDRDLLSQSNARTEDQYNQKYGRFQIRQALLNLEAVKRVAMSRYDERIASVERALAHQELIERVTNAYFDILLAQEQGRLVEAQLQATQAQLQQAERQREAGLATRTDVDEARAQLDRIKADQVAAANAVEIHRQQLRQIIGLRADQVAPLEPQLQFVTPIPDDASVWAGAALEQNPKARANKLAAEQALLNVDRASSRHYPTVDATAGYTYATATDNGAKRDKIARVGVEVNIPLYSGGGISAEARQATARSLAAQQQALLASSEAELAATKAFADLKSNLALVAALEQAVRSGESALHSAQMSAKVSYRTFVDVLNAQQLLYRSRFDLLRARFDYIRAFVRLQSAVGTLDETIVTEIDGWLE